MSASRQSIDRFLEGLIMGEAYDKEEGVWKFVDGSPCSVCVSSATQIAREFEGVVMGYWSKANPAAAIGGTLCEGHDFAFVADRWIVDYWAFRIAGVIQKPLLDLESEQERELATRLYGERDTWEVLTV